MQLPSMLGSPGSPSPLLARGTTGAISSAPQPGVPSSPLLAGPRAPLPGGPNPIAPVNAPQAAAQPPEEELFDPLDHTTIRKRVYDRSLEALSKLEPVSNTRHTLRLANVRYQDPEDFSLAKQKEALLSGGTLGRRVRGDWELVDNADGKVVDKRTSTIARIPHVTERGTQIHNGTEYIVVHQQRLNTGAFNRVTGAGEVETHVNIDAGKGPTHHYTFDPAKGVFKTRVSQAEIPLLPLLRTLGATKAQMEQAWGPEIYSQNLPHDTPAALQKLLSKFHRGKDPLNTDEERAQALRNAFDKMDLDPEVTKRTLGQPFGKLNADAILAATGKLVKMSRGEAEPDDRDHQAFQHLVGFDDLIAERLGKDAGGLRRQLLWKASNKGSLKAIPPSALTRQIDEALLSSGLGNPLEEVNPGDLIDKSTKVTRMGVGGIPSSDSIPMEARAVQPSMMGFIDPSRTPESEKIGVDTYLSSAVRRRKSDGALVTPVKDPRTGQIHYKTARELADSVIAPGKLDRKYVGAIQNGKMRRVKRTAVDYTLPNFEGAFNHLSNLIPMKSASKVNRAAMGARMLTQALPLEGAEAPHVQGAMFDKPGRSYEEEYGKHFGAVNAPDKQGGTVVAVSPDEMTLRYDDGTTEKKQLYNRFPFNRKTSLHNTALVQPGERFAPGQTLAKSNYTDDKGRMALGLNASVAYMPVRGNFEDAFTVTESFAKRLVSQHTYQHELPTGDKSLRTGRSTFIGAFPGKYTKDKLAQFDEHGVIKPGTKVEQGDPLILAVKDREAGYSRIHKRKQAGVSDASQIWDHDSAGVVSDVVHTPKGISVVVESKSAAIVGDKLCYDAETQVCTRFGWKPISELTLADEIATLNPKTELLEWNCPTQLHRYRHEGDMYRLRTKTLDILTTMEHRHWVRRDGETDYQPMTSRELLESKATLRFKRDCKWVGVEQAWMEFPHYKPRDSREQYLPRVRMDDWLEFLGYYLAEGRSCRTTSGGYHVQISQFRTSKIWKCIDSVLRRLKLRFAYRAKENRFEICSKWLYGLTAPLGDSYSKFVPEYVQALGQRQLRIFYEAYLGGDGHRGDLDEYGSSSLHLAEGVELVCMKLGWAATVRPVKPAKSSWQTQPHWRGRVIKRWLEPSRPGSASKRVRRKTVEEVVQYDGHVYCVTVPNHILYVKRHGAPYWSMNSGRFGDKGVIGHILKDDEAPHGPDGKPYDVYINPLGVITRGNASQVHAALLGKIAALRGAPYKVQDFGDTKDMNAFVEAELKKHGLPATEALIDPKTQRKIPGVLTGNRYMLKLHHTAAAKEQARGVGEGSYTADDEPAKGQGASTKRLALLETNALISHGAYPVLRDAAAVRGQRNEDYWMRVLQGHAPPAPKVPERFRKFVAQLQGSGINVVQDGSKMHIMAQTDKDIDQLAGANEIKSGDTVDVGRGLKPLRGGLFDPGLTGGHGGTQWSFIRLPEPMPNPIMEEPIRKILGMTKQKFEDVLGGKDKLGEQSGPEALKQALENIDLDKEIAKAEQALHGSRKGARDDAFRKLGYLQSAKRLGVHPKDWMLTKVPVLPPKFRPISQMGGEKKMLMVADANYLYKELLDAKDNFQQLKPLVSDLSEERLGVYNSFKAVTGLGDPVHPKLVEKQVQGLLKSVLGSSPKFGSVQRRLISSTVDNVGRGTVTPNQDLDMDQLGLPEDSAWSAYRHYIVPRLTRRGASMLEALKAVESRSPAAKTALLEEMRERPVVMSRAPVWHKYGIMAFWPKLTKGKTIQVSPMIVKGYTMDFDGDAVNFHVPADKDAVESTIQRMLPSMNLFQAKDLASPAYGIHNEFAGGLYSATSSKSDKRPRTFATKKDAMRAIAAGEISGNDPIKILED